MNRDDPQPSMKPIFYMAPLLGITDACFRSAYMESFGGFDCAISPFVKTLQGQRYKISAVNDLAHDRNRALAVYPQVLSNHRDDFVHLAKVLFDMGFPTINLNMGCPVPTAAGRGRGAGLLAECDFVDRFLDQVLQNIPNRLSIKTRIGFNEEDDLLKMVPILNRYPLHEIIIHPRTAKQKYRGIINHPAFTAVSEALKHRVVYSGDIRSVDDFRQLQGRYPEIQRWMIGRGILNDPFLMQKISGCDILAKRTVRYFLTNLADRYGMIGLSRHLVLERIKVLLGYLYGGQAFSKEMRKKMRKTREFDSLMTLLDDDALKETIEVNSSD